MSDGLFDGRTLAALCAEAQANYASADRQVCDVVTSDNCDGRGGYRRASCQRPVAAPYKTSSTGPRTSAHFSARCAVGR